MATVLRMPEVAANATEAVLAEWMVAEGASFSAGDILATVETEKALVDIEAETDGVLVKLLVPGGAQVDVASAVAVLGEVGETVTDLPGLLQSLGVAEAVDVVVPERRDVPSDSTSESPARPDTPPAPAENGSNGRVFASPLARKLARASGLAVEELTGTGPRNRILRRDVERTLAARRSSVVEPGPSVVELVETTHGAYDEIPHSRLRRAIAARLRESKREAPHFYLRASIRADKLMALRAEINEGSPVRVSLNDLIVKAVAAAHARVPEMNATWTDDAVRRHHRIDIAVAVATDRGLVTPVVRDVSSHTVTALAAKVQDLASRARDGKLKQDELEGGTISVTNLGMYGVEEFAAIINPPHAAILAVGAVREEPVVVDGALAVGKVLRLTLSVDHRPVDGVVAAQWLAAIVELLESPVRLLA
ncbi:MAG: hypothetical protein JWO11_1364 [Nocardioides sp.]|nr:hypothetical protein [Nocardioides sp.]